MKWLPALVLVTGCDRLLGLGSISALPDAPPPPDAAVQGVWSSVAGGGRHTCAIELDGSLWCWGANVMGQVGVGSTAAVIGAPTRVDSNRWVAVSTADATTCAIRDDHSLWCWGLLASGNADAPVVQPGEWTEVRLGPKHACAIDTGHGLWCWGDDAFGKLGPTAVNSTPTPVPVPGMWKDVAVGIDHTCAIDAMTDELACWGGNYVGQLGDGTSTSRQTPKVVGGATHVGGATYTRVAAGGLFTCGITSDRHVRCWGGNEYGQLGGGTTSAASVPSAVGGDADDWVDIALGLNHACGVRADSSLWCWGSDVEGELASSDALAVSATPLRISVPDAPWSGGALGLGERHTCAVDANHRLWCAGGDAYAQLGDSPPLGAPAQVAGTWLEVSAADLSTCARDSNMAVWCWGENQRGQVGDGTFSTREVPALVEPTPATAISVGVEHACSLTGGALWCWGYNVYGVFGDGTTNNSVLPMPVQIQAPAPMTWTKLTTRGHHTCATDSGGTLWCWGRNAFAEVATTAMAQSNTPVQRVAVTEFDIGRDHTCWIASGAVVCSGYNGFGQVGNGTTGTGTQPVTLTMPAGFTPVALQLGPSASCAFDAGRNTACWGYNERGQLGVGSTADVYSPAPGPAGAWRVLALGDQHSCGIRDDQTLWCWGNNDHFQLGDATAAARTTPAQVGADADWDTITAGSSHTCARKTDGRLYCWGENDDGELGNGLSFRVRFQEVATP